MNTYLKCRHCRYRTGNIDDPWGLPAALVPRVIAMHRMAHPRHELAVVVA